MAIFSSLSIGSSILSGLKFIPKLFKSKKAWIVIGIVAVLGIGWYLWTDYQDIRSELATQIEKKEELEQDIKDVEAQIAEEREQIKSLRDRNQMITANYLSKMKELREARANKSELKENPDVGAAKIEQSMNNYMDEMTCITGGGQCSEDDTQ